VKNGSADQYFKAFISIGFGALLIRTDHKHEKPRFGQLGGIHQWVELGFDAMKGQLNLEDNGGGTIPGVHSRVAGRLIASRPASGTPGAPTNSTKDPSPPRTISTHSSTSALSGWSCAGRRIRSG
jgi:hypothetical protein